MTGDTPCETCHLRVAWCVIRKVRVLFFFMTAMAAGAQVNAVEIMARVAVNQDAAEKARAAFVYRQKIAIRLRDGHGRLVREELSEYQVTPHEEGTDKELVKFSGRYQKGGAFISYIESERGQTDGVREEVDSDLAHDLRDDLANDKASKDGVARDLFPLTASEQRKYRFTLKGEEKYRGIEVYRIAFEPNDESVWSGEALISKRDCQPVLVTTKMAKKIPLFVRTALGTNLQGLGFAVEYKKFADNVWFPVSYGSEFRLRI